MASTPKKVDLSKSPLLEGMRVADISLKPIELEKELDLRLHKERVSF